MDEVKDKYVDDTRDMVASRMKGYIERKFGKRKQSFAVAQMKTHQLLQYGIPAIESGEVVLVTEAEFSRWVNAERDIPIWFVRAFSDTFGVSANYLLGLSESQTIDANAQAAAEYLGVSDETVDTIRGVSGVLSTFRIVRDLYGKDVQPLIEAIIQSPYFTTMFQGYMLFIDHSIREYTGDTEHSDFYHSELVPSDYDNTPYIAKSVIESNAFEAAKDIQDQITEYCKKHQIPSGADIDMSFSFDDKTKAVTSSKTKSGGKTK